MLLKNTIKKFTAISFFCLLATINLIGQVSATADIDRDSIAIGEQLTLDITLEKPEGQAVEWPRLLGNVGDFEIVKFTPISSETSNGITKETQSIQLTSFEEGYFALPGLPFVYDENNRRQQVQTKGAMIAVGTVAVDTSQAFMPIKAVESVKVPFTDYFWYYLNKYKWLIIAFVLLLALFVWAMNRFFGKKTEEIEIIKEIIPSDKIALSKLDALERQKLWQKGQTKRYYVELTEILREYVENRFDIPALESTTEEIMEGLDKSPVNSALSQKLQVLLNEADLVKFAKAVPEEQTHKQRMKDAQVFVQHTKNLRTETEEATTVTQP